LTVRRKNIRFRRFWLFKVPLARTSISRPFTQWIQN